MPQRTHLQCAQPANGLDAEWGKCPPKQTQQTSQQKMGKPWIGTTTQSLTRGLVTRPQLTSVTPPTAPQVDAQCLEVTRPHYRVPTPPSTYQRRHPCSKRCPPRVLKGELGHELCFSPKGAGAHPTPAAAVGNSSLTPTAQFHL